MTREEALKTLKGEAWICCAEKWNEALEMAIKALEQEPCEMTAEEYRQRMIQAFHNAGTDELIAVCVLPTEKEFEHLEWLLKNHYKKEPFDDAISRQAAIDCLSATKLKKFDFILQAREEIKNLPSVSTEKTGRWKRISIDKYSEHAKYWYRCNRCGKDNLGNTDWCPNCGAKMEVENG